MPKSSQSTLYRYLQQAIDPISKRDLALELLAITQSRQYVEAALKTLEESDLGDDHRTILRERTHFFFEHPAKDKAGMIRERLVRLLTHIGHPDDLDIYLKGVTAYYHQPITDVAQNLRAAALLGIASINPHLACFYATHLMGEPDTSTFNGEPSMTAVEILARADKPLPIYHFLLRLGEQFIQEGKAEVVGRAIESLGQDFPLVLYQILAANYLEIDVPIVSSGIVSTIITQRLVTLYPLVEQILRTTRHNDLYHFAVIMVASNADEDLIAMLHRLALSCEDHRLVYFIEAINLMSDTPRRELLASLDNRL